MKSIGKAAGISLLSLAFLFFTLFSQSGLIRYVSSFFLAAIALILLYILTIPKFIKLRYLDSAVRGIRFENMDIRLEVRNTSAIPVSQVTLTIQTGGLFCDQQAYAVDLRPFEKRVITFSCRGHRRGGYIVGPVRVSGSDPFGFLVWKKQAGEHLRVIVYPSIFTLELPNTGGLPAGNLSTNNKIYEDLTRFRSIREYIPGDDIKRINWKATAKTNKLYSNEFDPAHYFSVLIVLNLSTDDYPVRRRDFFIEHAAETAASAVYYFTKLKQIGRASCRGRG